MKKLKESDCKVLERIIKNAILSAEDYNDDLLMKRLEINLNFQINDFIESILNESGEDEYVVCKRNKCN